MNFKIFYAKSLRDVGMGKRWIDKCVAEGYMENPFVADNYHSCGFMWTPPGQLEDQLEFIFEKFQVCRMDETTAFEMHAIAVKNNSHMSMSVGDLIHDTNTKKTYMVDNTGFVEIEFQGEFPE